MGGIGGGEIADDLCVDVDFVVRDAEELVDETFVRQHRALRRHQVELAIHNHQQIYRHHQPYQSAV
jgi:hypothetical protein